MAALLLSSATIGSRWQLRGWEGMGGYGGAVLANLAVWKRPSGGPGDYWTTVNSQLWYQHATISMCVCVRATQVKDCSDI